MNQRNLEAAVVSTTAPATRIGRGHVLGLATAALSMAMLVPGVSASAASPSAASPNATWSQLQPATSPSPRSNPAMASDPDTGQFILFSGWPGRGYAPDDTWE